MTVGGTAIADAGDGARAAPNHSATLPELVLGICPFILRPDGGRTLAPSRDQRCTAIAPAPILAPEKQRRLCLSSTHTTCATYQAAMLAAGGGPPSAADDEDFLGQTATHDDTRADERVGRWRLPTTAPVILDAGRPLLATVLRDRSAPQVLLASLMAVAFAVLLAARLSPGPVVTGAAPSLGSLTAVVPSPAPPSATAASTTPSAAPSESPAASAPSSPLPSASIGPSSTPVVTLPPTGRTYTVRSGDTLAAIAGRFGTTVKAIMAANHLTNPRVLRVGQVLVIPS